LLFTGSKEEMTGRKVKKSFFKSKEGGDLGGVKDKKGGGTVFV